MISAEARKIAVCDTSLRRGNPVLRKRSVLNKYLKHRATVVGVCFPKPLQSQTTLGNLALRFVFFGNIQEDLS